MLRRTVLILLIATTMCSPLTVQPAAAATPQAAICTVVATVSVNPGVIAMPPPSSSAGGYLVTTGLVVCVGTAIGDATLESNGGTGLSCGPELGVLISSFCGSFQTFGFNVSGQTVGNGRCVGYIGGPQLVFGPSSPTGPWSLTSGPIMTGSLTNVDCWYPAGSIVNHTFDRGAGVLVAVAEPDPRTANVLGGGCSAPNPGPAGPALLYFCGTVLEGVAVIVE